MEFPQYNESLQSVDRMRRRFDDAVAELGELEIENSLSNQQVLEVIQRGDWRRPYRNFQNYVRLWKNR